MQTQFKYWAFISYSHADKKWGDWLHGALETYRVPKPLVGSQTERGELVPPRAFPIFRDREELPTSSDLGSVISRALEQSRYLVVICSPQAAGSRWVNQEILDFKRMAREDRILALIVDGEPNAGDGKAGFAAESESFPEALKYPLGADGNLDKERRTEPIAADARAGKDGKADSRLKLLAGILGLNYDDLKRRDEGRRRRQQRIFVSVSAALVLVFATLAGAALWQWRQANLATKEANKQRQEAETRKEEAVTQRHAAEVQKTIADEKSVEAETEKERVEAQTLADEEDLGRGALLRGDQLAAAEHLELAYEIRQKDPSVRLMLRAAMSGLDGLTEVLRGESGQLTGVEVAPGSGLILGVFMDGTARVWEPKSAAVVATFGRSGNEYNHIRAAAFASDGKRVLFANESDAFLEDLGTGQKITLSIENGHGVLAKAVFSQDGHAVMTDIGSYDGKKFTTHLTTFNSRDGGVLAETDIPDTYALITATSSGTQAILVGGPTSAGASSVRKAIVVELATGKIAAEIPVDPNDQVLPNPQGDLILVCHLPGKPPAVYSTRTGEEVVELSAKGLAPFHAEWSPSGRYVISNEPTSATLWDASSWKPIRTWPNAVWYATAVNQDESLLATVGWQGVVAGGPRELSVWNFHTGELLRQFHDGICVGDSVWNASLASGTLRFLPDGQHLVHSDSGSCATVWEWQKTQASQPVLSGHTATLRSIEFNRDGSRAVTGSDDGSAIVWKVATGAAESKLKDASNPPGAGVPMAEFGPDAGNVVTGGSFQPAKLWDAASGKLLRTLSFDEHGPVIGDVVRIGMGERRSRLVTFNSNGWGALWDAKTLKQIKSLHTEDGGSVRAVSFARNGSGFVVGDSQGFAFVFDGHGELKRMVGKKGAALVAAEIALQGERVVTADENGLITIWRLPDGHALQTLNSAKDSPRVNDVHFSPDGSMILAACADNKARVWNATTGQMALTVGEETLPSEMNLPAPMRADLSIGTVIQAGMLRVLFSPDQSFVAGTNESGHVLVWDAKTGKQLRRFIGHIGRVTSLAFTANGSRLGSSSEDNSARIWDLGLEDRGAAEIKGRLEVFGGAAPR